MGDTSLNHNSNFGPFGCRNAFKFHERLVKFIDAPLAAVSTPVMESVVNPKPSLAGRLLEEKISA